MGKFKFLALSALAALMLPACSSDPIAEGPENPNEGAEQTGNSYIAVNLKLPTRSGASRANDNFDDGLASEYAVQDAMLILFKKEATEAASTFHSAYDLKLTMNMVGTSIDNITEQATKVVKVSADNTTIQAITNAEYYALVVLNRNQVLSLNAAGTLTYKNGASTETASNTTTFETIGKAITANTDGDCSAFTTNGFLMSNAIISSVTGATIPATADITTLVEVTGNIKSTEADALDNAASIYVERAMAKVGVGAATGGVSTENLKVYKTEVNAAGVATETQVTTGLSAEISSWTLGNLNTQSYLVRQWQATTPARTEGDWYKLSSAKTPATTAMDDNKARFLGFNANPYRTYWCLDPNYDNATVALAKTGTTSDAIAMPATAPAHVYCFENTFDLSLQKIQNTTCAVIEMTIKTGVSGTGNDDFYVINDDPSLLYSNTDVANYLAAQAVARYGEQINHLWDATLALPDNEGDKIKITTSATVASTAAGAASYTITFTPAADGVTLKGTYDPITFVNTTFGEGRTDWDNFKGMYDVTLYKGGKAYYYVPIKHFGDDLCPWAETDANNGNSYPAAYNTALAPTYNYNNWLGRYGLVRNNWYEIQVASVKRIGSATVPNLSTKTDWDDQPANYLALKIYVLSWAKRTQSVDLQ